MNAGISRRKGMINQQFFTELEKYLKSSKRPEPRRPGARFYRFEPVPDYGPKAAREELHIRAAVKDVYKKKINFESTGAYFYEKVFLPALKDLDSSGFETEGRRIFRELKNKELKFDSNLFGRYADINPKRISAWRCGSEKPSKENLLKSVIALKLKPEAAAEFMAAGGHPFDTDKDAQDAVICFTIKYADEHKEDFSVEDYKNILAKGHEYAHYKGIYDKPGYKKPENEAYEPAPEYIGELTRETEEFLAQRNEEPAEVSNKKRSRALLEKYIIPFIDKKHAGNEKIGTKDAYYEGSPNITNFFESARIGQTTKDEFMAGAAKVSKATMLKLAIAMEMLCDDAQEFLAGAGYQLDVRQPLDFVVVCTMEYEQEQDFIFSPDGFCRILDECRNSYEFNYTNIYRRQK